MQKQWRPTRRYLASYKALYSTEGSDGMDLPQKPAKPRKKRKRKEQVLQCKLSAWMAEKRIVHHHSPNGGFRYLQEASNFRRMGTSAGYPDLHIPYARKGYHGLYIELKVDDNKLNENQEFWRDFLVKEGNLWYEGRDFDLCVQFVENYFR